MEFQMKGPAAALLAALANQSGDDEKPKKFKPIHQQKSLLEGFLEHSRAVASFKVGDVVARTAEGEKRYKAPKKGQIAIIATVFDKPVLGDNGRLAHGE